MCCGLFSSTFILHCTRNGFLKFLSGLSGKFSLKGRAAFWQGWSRLRCTAQSSHAAHRELLHGLCRFRRIVHFGREGSNRWLCRFLKTCPILPRSHLGVESLVLGACAFRTGISWSMRRKLSVVSFKRFPCADVLPNLRDARSLSIWRTKRWTCPLCCSAFS